MRIAITGANGFVGRELADQLRAAGHDVLSLVRRPSGLAGEIVTGPLEDADPALLADGLAGTEGIAHLAARTHVLHDEDNALAAYRRANVAATRRLLDAATRAGVRRIVYMSSIKVNGEETHGEQRFSGKDAPAPEDAYGQTKLEAERLVAASGMEHVILRPPMVYGTGVGGNFARLVGAVRRGFPLPFGRLRNRRSLISVRNLADATALALVRSGVDGAVLTLADAEDVSTRALVEAIGAAVGRPARLLPAPVGLLRLAGWLAGRSEEVRRLVGDLRVDTGAARTALGWTPGDQPGPALRRMLAGKDPRQ